LLATRRPLVLADTGWGAPSDRQLFIRSLAADSLNTALFTRLLDAGFARQTCSRAEVITDREWYRSDIYRDYIRPTRLDPFIFSVQPLSAGDTVLYLLLQRPHGARPFPKRAHDLVSLCMRELTRSSDAQLAGARDPSIGDVSPRLRQVLRYLL